MGCFQGRQPPFSLGNQGAERKIRDHVRVIRDGFASPAQVLQALAKVVQSLAAPAEVRVFVDDFLKTRP